MSGSGEIAPKRGIDKSFAQFDFYDPTQAKSNYAGESWKNLDSDERLTIV